MAVAATNDASTPLAPPTGSAFPEVGERYRIVRELGRGGTAVVYLAHDLETGTDVAIKVIHAHFLGDADAVARFAREARLVARLSHPGIVPIHAVERLDNGSLALVMPHVAGHTVKELLRDHGAFAPGEAQRVLDDVADALGFAHAQGIVHRDVKPENIFVDDASGRALLADFGIARSMDTETQLTMAGVAIGTPTYMAPEQIDGGAIDGRSDLYSLGLVGWEMLTGRRPWQGESLYGIIYRQKHDELEAIDAIRQDVPERLVAAVEGLLSKAPDDRWASAGAFRDSLSDDAPIVRHPRSTDAPDAATETIAFRRPAHIARAVGGTIGADEVDNEPAADYELDPPRAGVLAFLGNPVARRVAVAAAAVVVVATTLLVARAQDASARNRNVRTVQPTADRPPSLAIPAVAGAVVDGPAADTVAAQRAGVDSTTVTGIVTQQTPAFAPPVAVGQRRHATAAPITLPAPTVAATSPDAGERLTVRAPAPPPIVTPSADARRFAIATGAADTCVLSAEGTAYCWGSNSDGQLGGPRSDSRATSVVAPVRFASIAPGLAHTCALAASGAAYCWGNNDRGELGDGSTTSHGTPVRVSGNRSFSSIVAGAEHSCALTGDGSAYCWGAGGHGELGNGHEGDRSLPTPVAGGVRFEHLVSGWHHVCGLTSDGSAYCWGANESGELGDGTTAVRAAPTQVHTPVRFVALAAGSAHTCGITAAGAAYCWGANRYGQLGDGTTETRTTPVPVDGDARFATISTGGVHTCALTRDHDAWCWGRNDYGQLGDGSGSDRLRPVRVAGDHAFAALSAFGAHTCGATTTNELFCWGYNLDGQVGDGTRENRYRPVYIDKPTG